MMNTQTTTSHINLKAMQLMITNLLDQSTLTTKKLEKSLLLRLEMNMITTIPMMNLHKTIISMKEKHIQLLIFIATMKTQETLNIAEKKYHLMEATISLTRILNLISHINLNQPIITVATMVVNHPTEASVVSAKILMKVTMETHGTTLATMVRVKVVHGTTVQVLTISIHMTTMPAVTITLENPAMISAAMHTTMRRQVDMKTTKNHHSTPTLTMKNPLLTSVKLLLIHHHSVFKINSTLMNHHTTTSLCIRHPLLLLFQ
jgi:hypothetical protein